MFILSYKGIIWVIKPMINSFQNQSCIDNEDHTVCNTLTYLAISFTVQQFLFLLLELLNSNMLALLPICY